MADSVIWGALQQALFDLLDGTSAITTPIHWGYDPDHLEEECISVGFEEETEREWRLIAGGAGPLPQDENFRNQIVVEAQRASGTDLKPAYDRVSAICKQIEDAVRVDVSVGGIVFQLKLTRVRRSYRRTDSARIAIAFLDLTGTARF